LLFGTEVRVNVLQENGRKDFEVGEEVLAKCSSFNAKGVPVFSLLD
jgi:polyribonucleotide nucleotidyltransferase